MARRIFYSFHYNGDNARASQIRNMGVVEGNRPVTDNDWEQIKKGGDTAIANWIHTQLEGKSCCIVLIGKQTAGRKWVSYEIAEAWNQGKGVFGIYIHNLKSLDGNQSLQGTNPFDHVSLKESGQALSRIVPTYDPPYSDSKQVYAYIKKNLVDWIEVAMHLRTLK